jgi:dTMP kinase
VGDKSTRDLVSVDPVFITFEGIEGSGKSTHLRHLAAQLRAERRTVVETCEPGDTTAGHAIRQLVLGAEAAPLTPLAELFLYCADRTQHVHEVIRPALDAGRIVLCDRFSDSTLAYQGYGRGIDLDVIRALDLRARDALWPALTFLLDCPVEAGLARARGRSRTGDRFEREAVAFHERVRAGFLALAAAEPRRVCVIDAAPPLERVQALVVDEARRRLGARA